MKRITQLLIAAMMLIVPAIMASGSAITSEDHISAVVSDSKFSNPGDTVRLHYGMPSSVKDAFCVNNVVPVYRMGKGYYYSKAEVGTIRVTKDLGNRYVEGVVVNGTLRPGDVAMKASSECKLGS